MEFLDMEASGTWATALYIVAGMDFLAAFCAWFVLRPLLIRHHSHDAATRAALGNTLYA
jgi:hypothetical protein